MSPKKIQAYVRLVRDLVTRRRLSDERGTHRSNQVCRLFQQKPQVSHNRESQVQYSTSTPKNKRESGNEKVRVAHTKRSGEVYSTTSMDGTSESQVYVCMYLFY